MDNQWTIDDVKALINKLNDSKRSSLYLIVKSTIRMKHQILFNFAKYEANGKGNEAKKRVKLIHYLQSLKLRHGLL